MKQRFYMDTSVWGGTFDREFEEETTVLFEKVRLGQIVCVYSDLIETELSLAPKRIRDYFQALDSQMKEKVPVTPDALNLARNYVAQNVVGETSFDDCIHIATATVHKVDLLVSWNFKHIVNVYRIRGYNSVNMKLGYPSLNIHSPKEIVGL